MKTNHRSRILRILGVGCLLGLGLSLAAPARAAIFVASMGLKKSNETGGGATLIVNLGSRSWSLSGEISNLVHSATAAGIQGPPPPGESAPFWLSLTHPGDKKGLVAGNGYFTAEEFDWLQNGLLSIRVWSDRAAFPEGEVHARFVEVPEPMVTAGVTALGLCGFALHRRRKASGFSSRPRWGIPGRRRSG